MEGGQPVVAREEELGLAHLLGETERLSIVPSSQLGLAVALVDLAEHDQGHREVVELAELAVQLDRGRAAAIPSSSQRLVSAQ